MADDKKAWELHASGLDAWQSGDLDKAAVLIREAIDLSDPSHPNLEMYYGALGGVLSGMGHNSEARAALEKALDYAFAQARFHTDDPDSSSGVVVARYFLAEHLLGTGAAAEALASVDASIGHGSRSEGIIQYVRARALLQLGRSAEAKEAAQQAIELATSDELRQRIADHLRECFESAV